MLTSASPGKRLAIALADLEATSNAPWFAASKLPKSLEPVSDGERRLLMFEPLPVWRQVGVPVQAIWGARDINLPAGPSRDMIVMALAGGGNRDFETHILPGLTHGLLRAKNPGEPWDFVRGSAELEPLIADWLTREVLQN
jgi:pimeloyl-ACP methyl ester carboxylesterase